MSSCFGGCRPFFISTYPSLAESVGGQDPNFLVYVDSWEQDEALYIQVELCKLGNFALFLDEFGLGYPRLDKARVWKISVDLSNVSITRHQ